MIQYGTHIAVLWAFRGLKASIMLDNGFVVCIPVNIDRVGIIQVTISVKPIFSVRKYFTCTIVITFGWMMVNFFDSADNKYLSLSSREVFCGYSGWQWWSFWQFKSSRTSRLKVWPECFDDVFTMWNVSNSWLLLVLGTRCLLCGMWVLAALLHLQTVVGLGHSLQFHFVCLFPQFQVGFSFRYLQFDVIICQYSVIGLSKLPYYDFFPKGLPSGYRLSPANHVSPKINAGIHLDSM